MENALQALEARVSALSPVWTALFFHLFGWTQGFVPFFPGDLFLLFGAALLPGWEGVLSVLLAYWAGTTAASLAVTELGRAFGPAWLRARWFRRVFPESRQKKAAAWLQRRGPWSIVAAKFVTGMNLPVLLLNGALRGPRPPLYRAVVSATALHNALFYFAGAAVVAYGEAFFALCRQHQGTVALALALGIALAYKHKQAAARHKQTAANR